MRVVPAFLTHVAAAFRKVDARVPSPFDILAEAAAMVAEDAAKSTTPSALDAIATALASLTPWPIPDPKADPPSNLFPGQPNLR